MKKVVFDESDLFGGGNKKELSIQEAVKRQKKAAQMSNYYYLDDKDALDDFLVTNLAWIEETSPSEE